MAASSGKETSEYENFSSYKFDPDDDSKYVSEIGERFASISNIEPWWDGINYNEYNALDSFTGSGYEEINDLQYNTAWEDMSSYDRDQIATLHDALSKFELNKGIEVNRATSFLLFGAPDRYTKMSMSELREYFAEHGTTVQNDGFMSFSTRYDGIPLEGSGLVIHLRIPPSKGAGAYLGSNVGINRESEFLVNSNAVMKFDPSSMYSSNGQIHITADWLGQAKAQTISKTYTGALKVTAKSKKGKK